MDEVHPIDLTGTLDASHENKWVAFSPDYRRVVSVADRLADLMRQVGERDVVFHRVLPQDVSFVPSCRG